MNEWRNVIDNNNYIVSDNGGVRNSRTNADKAIRESRGYFSVNLYKHGKRTTKGVHVLVAEAFIPNPDGKPEVNHKDGNNQKLSINLLNNHVSNLEWVTHKENCEHAWRTGLQRPSYGRRGKKNPNAGRKGKPFRIVETSQVFNTLKECEEAIGADNRHINDCLRGRQKTHRGYHFEYIDP